METPLITKTQFNRVRHILPVRNHARRMDDRMVLSAIIFLIRNGLAWRHLPEFYGNWKSIYSRFSRWSRAGITAKIFQHFALRLSKNCDAMLDSSYVKAQRSASSLKSDGNDRGIGRSRGGMTSKIHLLSNTLAQPMDFIITGGEVHDSKIASVLLTRNRMKRLLADKAYDTDAIRAYLKGRGIEACIPPKSNRKMPAIHDKTLYRKRHIIENMFSRLKDWKGIAFRVNRCFHTFHSFVALALLFIFLNADRA